MGQDPCENRHEPVLVRAAGDLDAVLLKFRREIGVDPVCPEVLPAVLGRDEAAFDASFRYRYLGDLPVL